MDAEVPEKWRDKALDQLDRTINKELASLGRRCRGKRGSCRCCGGWARPQKAKAIMTKMPKTESGETEEEDRIWLGVCAHAAQEYNIDVRVARLAAVLAGLITGPLRLLLISARLSCSGRKATRIKSIG